MNNFFQIILNIFNVCQMVNRLIRWEIFFFFGFSIYDFFSGLFVLFAKFETKHIQCVTQRLIDNFFLGSLVVCFSVCSDVVLKCYLNQRWNDTRGPERCSSDAVFNDSISLFLFDHVQCEQTTNFFRGLIFLLFF